MVSHKDSQGHLSTTSPLKTSFRVSTEELYMRRLPLVTQNAQKDLDIVTDASDRQDDLREAGPVVWDANLPPELEALKWLRDH